MPGAISDSVLLRILAGDEAEPLSSAGIEQLWLAVATLNQATEGSLQIWADTDANGVFTRMDMFDDLFDLGDVTALNPEFTEFFNALGRKGWLTLSLIDGNWAVDLNYEIPVLLNDFDTRERLIASLAVSEVQDRLHQCMKTYAAELLNF